MAREIDREEVRKLLAAGAQLVDVLPRPQYEQEHIAGAISIPLARLADEANRLQREGATIVYCYDAQ
jgi:rhodanese-related sulfurtransferase